MDIMNQRHQTIPLQKVLVIISCCLITCFGIGFSYSFGTFFTDIMTTFGINRAETAVIQSTLVSVFLLTGLMNGMLIKKFGIVKIGIFGSLLFSFSLEACFFASSLTYLVISIGVFSGIGISCIFICATDVIGRQFSGNKRFLLMGMQAVSGAVGGMVYPYLLRYLSDLYGWRGALLLIGAISSNAVPCCIIWKHPLDLKRDTQQGNSPNPIADFQNSLQVETEVKNCVITIKKTEKAVATVSDSIFAIKFPVLKGEQETKTVIVTDAGNKKMESCCVNSIIGVFIKSVLCNSWLMLYVFGIMLAVPFQNFIIIFLGDIYNDNGLTKDDVSFGLLLYNLFGIFGRLLPGIVFQFKFVSSLILPLVCSVVSAVLFLLFTFVNTRWLIFAITALLGMFRSTAPVVTFRLVGRNLLPVVLGTVFTFNGISNLVLTPLNGLIRDISGSYTSIYYTGTAFQVLAALVFLIAFIIRRTKKQKTIRNSSLFYITSF
ncbi:monocarboxylate transporter 14-like isoform X1 [Ruditapes philippinarum]|uniref:monocarboxylate transporter 14-like isoform X1 n=1 Tax=Ruditapes philippinarum TaxID=129788 RepID=UPI00295AA92F|nr:monocarboxylate transporter 14-like isoform X1 [Ruditapes philippinarum]